MSTNHSIRVSKQGKGERMGKRWKWQEIGSALLMMAAGFVLLFMPEMTLVTIANVIGVIVMIIGAIYLISYFFRRQVAAGNYDLVKGLIIMAAGIFICVQAELVVSILPVLLGIGVVISGIVKLQHALDLRRMGYETWVRIGITAAVNILIGLLVVMNPFSTVAWLMRFIGIGFILSGVTDLITAVYVSKKASEYYVDGEAEER